MCFRELVNYSMILVDNSHLSSKVYNSSFFCKHNQIDEYLITSCLIETHVQIKNNVPALNAI